MVHNAAVCSDTEDTFLLKKSERSQRENSNSQSFLLTFKSLTVKLFGLSDGLVIHQRTGTAKTMIITIQSQRALPNTDIELLTIISRFPHFCEEQQQHESMPFFLSNVKMYKWNTSLFL